MAQPLPSPQDEPSLVPGISPDIYGQLDFERIVELAKREAGIALGDEKAMLVYSRLAPLLREHGLHTFRDYLGLVQLGGKALSDAIAALTTNHTYFFREPQHFAHFVEHVRPGLLARAKKGHRVRLWSAGCSSGEEIWTLLMVLLGEDLSFARELLNKDIKIIGTDISEPMVNAAALAKYPASALDPMPRGLREKWCEPTSVAGKDMFAIAQELKQMCRLHQHNLLRSLPFTDRFDVIFCRNVTIYFDEATKEQLLLRLARQLHLGGYLYIGHSERATGDAMSLLEAVRPTVYRRVS